MQNPLSTKIHKLPYKALLPAYGETSTGWGRRNGGLAEKPAWSSGARACQTDPQRGAWPAGPRPSPRVA